VKPELLATDSGGAEAPTPACTPCCIVCPLSDLARGGCARVVGLAGAPRLRRRLMALGLQPTAELAVLGRAPNDGPMELRAGTVHLMLRACEAAGVLVERTPPPYGRSPEDAHALPVV